MHQDNKQPMNDPMPLQTRSQVPRALAHKDTHPRQEAKERRRKCTDTEASMLSGISRQRKIRSNPYWFTEFCNSQCLSHFAAPFIVVRAETSVAESCKRMKWKSTQKECRSKILMQEKVTTRQEAEQRVTPEGMLKVSLPAPSPSSFCMKVSISSPPPPRHSRDLFTVIQLDACE